MHTKSFEEHYSEQQCADLLRDWQDVVLTAFTCAVYDAFQIGDQPESDVNDALTALKGAVMEWVDEAVKYGLSDYLDAQGYDGGTEYRMRQGGSTSYGWMSRATPLQRKAMTAGDATTGGFAEKADTLRGAAEDATNAVEKHVKALHDTAAQMKALVNGAAPVTPAKAAQIKAGRAFSAAHEKALTEHADGLDSAADTLQHNMTRHMKAVTTVADDLATVLQGSEAAYGADHGTPTDGQQQGKQRQKRAPSPSETRAPRTPPSSRDTVREEDVSLALSTLRSLRTSA